MTQTLQEYIDSCRLARDQRLARERQDRQAAEAARIAAIPQPLQPFVAFMGDSLNADIQIAVAPLAEMRVAFNGIIRVGGKTFTDFTEATAFAADLPFLSGTGPILDDSTGANT